MPVKLIAVMFKLLRVTTAIISYGIGQQVYFFLCLFVSVFFKHFGRFVVTPIFI